ncbi:protein kinase domain-containing protein [Peribacillus muralis]|uniref:protein kinase domain-containing protein n=1 Tax=Peribacillus muralis TaxID=264697 RepID=UPI003D008D50
MDLITNRDEIFLKNKYYDLVQKFGDENLNRYIDYYSHMPVQLRELLSLFHYEFNRLIKYLNSRIRNGRYTAHESRELLHLIEMIKTIQANLKDSELNFIFIPEYQERLVECEDFLQESDGSPIPRGYEKIMLIESKPIFQLRKVVSVPSLNRVTQYPTKMIGHGSYATVHKYKDEYYNRFFAIKKAAKDLNEKEYERFKTEFDEMKKLKSPYVIEVYKFDEEKRQYTMEYADETLDNYITKNNSKLEMNERIGIVRQILQAFIYINNKGVLHRDISTKNILIKKYEDVNVIKISDFGLVKLRNSTLTSKNTEFKGSLNDYKLELMGFSNYEVRHETYALTRLIYFVMTGKMTIRSFENKNLDKFVMRGISDNIKERYESVESLKKAFFSLTKSLL